MTGTTPTIPPTVIQPVVLSPPLKWAGGKRWLIPHLMPLWKDLQATLKTRRLVEPFCGGLAVALGLMPKNALLNDINPHLINFYRCVQRGLSVTLPMQNDPMMYYAYRTQFNDLIRNNAAHSELAAQLFYYLNRTGYNGLCRFNQSGEFNVPFGKYKTINYAKDFLRYQPILAAWELPTGFVEALTITKDDLIYADPPYDVQFVQYSKEGFSWADQVQLAEWLAAHPGPVIASNQATERIIALYTDLGFGVQYLDSPRRISANGDRTPAREILALKQCC